MFSEALNKTENYSLNIWYIYLMWNIYFFFSLSLFLSLVVFISVLQLTSRKKKSDLFCFCRFYWYFFCMHNRIIYPVAHENGIWTFSAQKWEILLFFHGFICLSCKWVLSRCVKFQVIAVISVWTLEFVY